MRKYDDSYMKAIDILAAFVLAMGGLFWGVGGPIRLQPDRGRFRRDEPHQPNNLLAVRGGGSLRNHILPYDSAPMGLQTMARSRRNKRRLGLEGTAWQTIKQ